MKIFLRDQTAEFEQHLLALRSSAVMKYVVAKLKEKRSSITINTTLAFDHLDMAPLFAYDVFPQNILTHYAEWVHERRQMRPGDTIVQQIYIPPVKGLSQKIICGVRVKEVIDEANRKGFSYETLEGHVEKGISTFTLERAGDNTISFVIQTSSEPTNILTRVFGPVFTLPYQAYCTRKALEHVKRATEGSAGNR